MSYQKGDLVFSRPCFCFYPETEGHDENCSQKENIFFLPHSCDEWIIGTLDNAKILKNDLDALIKKEEIK